MPFTPFHFGPGYLAAAATSKRPALFSFYVFALSQVVIDCETLYNMLTDAPRLHTFFHTFAGSLAAGALTLALYRPVYLLADIPVRLFPDLKQDLERWRAWDGRSPTFRTAVVTALLGAWSHVLFDAVDHSDVQPLAPWSGANPLHGLVSSGHIYLSFLLCGIVAFSWCTFRNRKSP